MADISTLLLASLNPQTRRAAEQNLSALSVQQGFLPHLLGLILDSSKDRAVRLSGSVYLKNLAKLRWEEDIEPLPETDKAALREQLVPAMLALSSPTDKAVRAQVAESVSLIAELDFPLKWPDLIEQLVNSLSSTDYNVNVGVLETAHSIFQPWRAHVRSDQLFEEINIVLTKFMDPFLQLFRQTANLILVQPSPNPALTSSPSSYALLAQTMVLLISIYHDFTCQDLPPAIEDSQAEFFAPKRGWFQAFLSWNPPELQGDVDDTTPSLPAQVKTGILEVVELFIKLYPEQLNNSGAVEAFVESVWSLVGQNRLSRIGDDGLVSQSLRFISTAIRSGYYKDLFSSKDVIKLLVEGVVIPNVTLREHEVEQFEDDPLEYIRFDLAVSLSGTELATRRQAAADVLQALVSSGYEVEATEIVGTWINTGLTQYNANKKVNWKAKDSAIYLLTAVATRGSTTQLGVTSINAHVNVVKFFSDHVFEDLEALPGTVHPILQVDAIKFLGTFRVQLTKGDLLSVLPLLAKHLGSENYVAYTYAAITIDRILSIKQGNQLLFAQADIHNSAAALIDALLLKIEAARTPEKLAENDHLMKCVMRVIVTARQTLIPTYENTLARLVNILSITSKNPSNPVFDQYLFEGISGLLRFIGKAVPASVSKFEQQLFPPFTAILQQDIDQYVPYVFQVLAQMLELHTGGATPPEYQGLLHLLLTPAMWQQSGSIPGLVRLLKAFLSQNSAQLATSGQVGSVLAVVQQRLIPSKQNDAWGFELLQSVFLNVKPLQLQQYIKPVFLSLLTRMQSSKTDKYVYHFSKFLLYAMAINVDGLGPEYVVQVFEEIQPGLWPQVLTNFVTPQTSKLPVRDRKLAAVSLIRLLCQSPTMMRDPAIKTWPTVYTVLGKLFKERQHFETKKGEEAATGVTAIDLEEQSAGYQAAYSRLAASEAFEADPVDYVQDVSQYLQGEMQALSSRYGSQVQMLISSAEGGQFA